MNEVISQNKQSSESMAKIIYILYLVSIILPITAIVGVVLAYLYLDDAPDWLKSHYRFQIRTFWIGALYMVIAAPLVFFIIGYVLLLFWTIWLIVRCAKGLKYLDQQAAHPRPEIWWL